MSEPLEAITLSGHEVMAYYHQLQLMACGESLPKPNAVSLLNTKAGKRRGARYWLKRLKPAYDSMTGCGIGGNST
jgi:hypothetical protein